MTRPIVATSSWVSEEQHAAAVEFAAKVNGGNGFQVAGVAWCAEFFRCCERSFYYAPMPSDGRVGLVHTVPKCPVCDPIGTILDDPDVASRDAALAKLVTALVDSPAVHMMMVALDHAQNKERTRVSDLRNPADVQEIAELRRIKGFDLALARREDHGPWSLFGSDRSPANAQLERIEHGRDGSTVVFYVPSDRR